MATSAKKRTKKDRSIDYEANAKTDSTPEVVEELPEVLSRKKKKKKKHHTEKIESDVDNRLDCSLSLENSVGDSTAPKKKKKKTKDKSEKLCESVSTFESGSKKEKKKSKPSGAVDNLETQVTEESTDLLLLEKKKKKNRKRQEDDEENASVDTKTEGEKNAELEFNVNDNISLNESGSQPALSALTRERMEKWKKRKPTKNICFLQDNEVNASVEPETEDKKNIQSDQGKKKPLPVTKLFNPNITVQNYNHKRVLAALGYDVKKYENKRIKIEMPPTKIPGSNLDSILGYGEGLLC